MTHEPHLTNLRSLVGDYTQEYLGQKVDRFWPYRMSRTLRLDKARGNTPKSRHLYLHSSFWPSKWTSFLGIKLYPNAAKNRQDKQSTAVDAIYDALKKDLEGDEQAAYNILKDAGVNITDDDPSVTLLNLLTIHKIVRLRNFLRAAKEKTGPSGNRSLSPVRAQRSEALRKYLTRRSFREAHSAKAKRDQQLRIRENRKAKRPSGRPAVATSPKAKDPRKERKKNQQASYIYQSTIHRSSDYVENKIQPQGIISFAYRHPTIKNGERPKAPTARSAQIRIRSASQSKMNDIKKANALLYNLNYSLLSDAQEDIYNRKKYLEELVPLIEKEHVRKNADVRKAAEKILKNPDASFEKSFSHISLSPARTNYQKKWTAFKETFFPSSSDRGPQASAQAAKEEINQVLPSETRAYRATQLIAALRSNIARDLSLAKDPQDKSLGDSIKAPLTPEQRQDTLKDLKSLLAEEEVKKDGAVKAVLQGFFSYDWPGTKDFYEKNTTDLKAISQINEIVQTFAKALGINEPGIINDAPRPSRREQETKEISTALDLVDAAGQESALQPEASKPKQQTQVLQAMPAEASPNIAPQAAVSAVKKVDPGDESQVEEIKRALARIDYVKDAVQEALIKGQLEHFDKDKISDLTEGLKREGLKDSVEIQTALADAIKEIHTGIASSSIVWGLSVAQRKLYAGIQGNLKAWFGDCAGSVNTCLADIDKLLMTGLQARQPNYSDFSRSKLETMLRNRLKRAVQDTKNLGSDPKALKALEDCHKRAQEARIDNDMAQKIAAAAKQQRDYAKEKTEEKNQGPGTPSRLTAIRNYSYSRYASADLARVAEAFAKKPENAPKQVREEQAKQKGKVPPVLAKTSDALTEVVGAQSSLKRNVDSGEATQVLDSLLEVFDKTEVSPVEKAAVHDDKSKAAPQQASVAQNEAAQEQPAIEALDKNPAPKTAELQTAISGISDRFKTILGVSATAEEIGSQVEQETSKVLAENKYSALLQAAWKRIESDEVQELEQDFVKALAELGKESLGRVNNHESPTNLPLILSELQSKLLGGLDRTAFKKQIETDGQALQKAIEELESADQKNLSSADLNEDGNDDASESPPATKPVQPSVGGDPQKTAWSTADLIDDMDDARRSAFPLELKNCGREPYPDDIRESAKQLEDLLGDLEGPRSISLEELQNIRSCASTLEFELTQFEKENDFKPRGQFHASLAELAKKADSLIPSEAE